jgi:hypothetical protein
MAIAASIGIITLMTALTCAGLWGIKRLCGPEIWAHSRDTKRRRRIMGALWFVYLMILCPGLLIALNLLQIVVTSPFLFFAAWGGVLTTGLLACLWFAKPNRFRGLATLVSIVLVASLIWLTTAMR